MCFSNLDTLEVTQRQRSLSIIVLKRNKCQFSEWLTHKEADQRAWQFVTKFAISTLQQPVY
jgi:hypothetical protein